MRNDIDPQYHSNKFRPRVPRTGKEKRGNYFRSDEPMHKHYPYYCAIYINRRIGGSPTWFLGKYGKPDGNIIVGLRPEIPFTRRY